MVLKYLTMAVPDYTNISASTRGATAPPGGSLTTLPVLACSVAAALLFPGCSRQESGLPAQRGKGLPVPVTLSVAAQKDVPIQLQAIGAARAYASVSVKARVDGQLAEVGFKQGDEVKKGALVFQIDPRPYESALKQAQAVLARDVASMENAEIDMRRTDELANTKAVSASVVDENRAKAASLRATVEADKAALGTAKLQLSFCSIVSPVNGRVGLLLVDEGNMVKNNETILAVINQTRPIYVDFSIPEQSLAQVRDAAAGRQLRVEAAIPQDTKHSATGELEVINNQVDSSTGTIMLRAKFPNEDELLWPGQFVNVTLTLGQMPNATVVSSSAVQSSQSGEFVFVVKADASVEKRPITLGPYHGAEVVIESGVKPGETVVTDGQLRLVPGAKVKAPEAAPQGKLAEGRSS
jgi:multidrug efflux system membrane fusion protein